MLHMEIFLPPETITREVLRKSNVIRAKVREAGQAGGCSSLCWSESRPLSSLEALTPTNGLKGGKGGKGTNASQLQRKSLGVGLY